MKKREIYKDVVMYMLPYPYSEYVYITELLNTNEKILIYFKDCNLDCYIFTKHPDDLLNILDDNDIKKSVHFCANCPYLICYNYQPFIIEHKDSKSAFSNNNKYAIVEIPEFRLILPLDFSYISQDGIADVVDLEVIKNMIKSNKLELLL